VRTLSDKERGYNPIGYHLGTVWPHDNSIIAAGFRRYGFDDAACLLFQGMVRAAMHFEAYRLPELFAGFRREDYDVPVNYPLANKPQAWAAGAIPYMLESLLGLQPEAFDHQLRVVRPILPEILTRVELHRLRVGGDRVDLRFERSGGGMAVQVLGRMGGLNVVVEL
jgi:glycogen debranching enzyme